MVGSSKRMMASVATTVYTGLGQITLAILAYFIRDYKILQLTISIPPALLIFLWWYVAKIIHEELISVRFFDD